MRAMHTPAISRRGMRYSRRQWQAPTMPSLWLCGMVCQPAVVGGDVTFTALLMFPTTPILSGTMTFVP